MERARRLEYLRTMGVEAWERRNLPRPIEAPALPSPHIAAPLTEAATLPLEAAVSSRARIEPPRPAIIRPQAPVATGSAAAALAGIPVVTAARAAGSPVSPEVEAQWESLQAEVLGCTKCALHSTRTQGVFGVGNRRAEWLIIGEAPGAEEDRRGEPFVGRAGQLLNAMLKAIGLPREQVFIANILKSRPPGNRDPKPDEVAACLPYLMRQIALLQPRLMLAVGRIAAQNLLATDMALGRLRGQVHHFGELNTPLIVTYHPAYLLRSPADKRKAWEDLKFARSTFQRLASQEQ